MFSMVFTFFHAIVGLSFQHWILRLFFTIQEDLLNKIKRSVQPNFSIVVLVIVRMYYIKAQIEKKVKEIRK